MDLIRVAIKHPGRLPEIRTIKNELKTLQEIVEGYIEMIQYKDMVLIVNEEGKLKGLRNNFCIQRSVYAEKIVGTVIFAGDDLESIRSLTDAEIEKIKRMFGGIENDPLGDH